ncbi:hypothetical protein ATANTOWER_031515 [Ataeniobius toweri]|uniref:Uncharacterized protein n=1 Tax=Ataeniobius toweri TaxID=208326 RepID=A0ABU7BJC8_9TELE|nr:hypothetical protein [Ataeniobius toweri]
MLTGLQRRHYPLRVASLRLQRRKRGRRRRASVYRSALPCAPLWQRLDAGCAGRKVRERPPGLTVKRGSGHLYANPGSAAAGEAGKSGRDPEGEQAGRLFSLLMRQIIQDRFPETTRIMRDSCCLLWGQQLQEGTPDVLLPGHTLQFIWSSKHLYCLHVVHWQPAQGIPHVSPIGDGHQPSYRSIKWMDDYMLLCND